MVTDELATAEISAGGATTHAERVELMTLKCYGVIRWATSSENVPSSMRKVYNFKLSCTCAKSHAGICSPFMHFIVSNDSVSGQQRT